jgi:gliding motility-associated-like protein
VDFRAVNMDYGVVNLIGSGNALVVSSTATKFAVTGNTTGGLDVTVAGQTQPVPFEGGALKGLLQEYNTDIPATRARLDALANSTAAKFDKLQATGLGLDGPLTGARFSLPQDVCVDADKNIYVGDRDNHVIRILTFDDSAFIDTNSPPPIVVQVCPPFALPNVFTPDDDGVNDLFTPFDDCQVRALDTHIYNRWGQVIYTTSDPRVRWNGRSGASGEAVPEGVYYYVCLLTEGSNGRRGVSLTGTVQLLR